VIITSAAFAAFTLAVLILYYALPGKAQNYLLLLASYVFLMSWDIRFAAVFLVLTVLNYAVAHRIAAGGSRGRMALRAGVLANVLALVYFRYMGFFLSQAQRAFHTFGLGAELFSAPVWLPIGLSFYAVQVIAYLFDVQKRVTRPVRDPARFALYMVYFPRVLSGPIERVQNFVPQLERRRSFKDHVQLDHNFSLILQGVVRKVVIADMLFLAIPPDVFKAPRAFSSPELLIWLLAYAFALYNDFAGYTSIVRGVSGLFGITLSENFNAPYLSRSFTEFWNRWHITLSLWLRDYIFLPATRSLLRHRTTLSYKLSIVVPPIMTMLVSAAWHGISWHMAVWGGLHGLYLVGERLYLMRHPARPPAQQRRYSRFASSILVFLLVVLAWVPFRAALPATLDYWIGLFSPARWHSYLANTPAPIINIMTVSSGLLIGLSFWLDWLQYPSKETPLRQSPALIKALAINAALFAIIFAILAHGRTPPPFVYQGF
jgi:alginate O-acetyltransferase complex protein AlgI